MDYLPGTVRVQLEGRFGIPHDDPATSGRTTMPWACPQCGAVDHPTLIARQREGLIECAAGHEWPDPDITASAVRQLAYQAWSGQPAVMPRRLQLTNTLPR